MIDSTCVADWPAFHTAVQQYLQCSRSDRLARRPTVVTIVLGRSERRSVADPDSAVEAIVAVRHVSRTMFGRGSVRSSGRRRRRSTRPRSSRRWPAMARARARSTDRSSVGGPRSEPRSRQIVADGRGLRGHGPTPLTRSIVTRSHVSTERSDESRIGQRIDRWRPCAYLMRQPVHRTGRRTSRRTDAPCYVALAEVLDWNPCSLRASSSIEITTDGSQHAGMRALSGSRWSIASEHDLVALDHDPHDSTPAATPSALRVQTWATASEPSSAWAGA